MTLQEVVDSFEVMMKIEFLKRGMTPIAVSKKMEALWLSQSLQDIQRKVKSMSGYQDITLVSNVFEYALSSDFGSLIMIEIAGREKLEVVSLETLEQRTQNGNSSSPSYDPTSGITATAGAVYFKGTLAPAPYIRFDGTPGVNPRIWYYKNWFLFTPAGVVGQDWGTFDGFAFSGNFVLTDDFVGAVHEYMLSKVFDDRLLMYEKIVRELKQARRVTIDDSLPYHLGDL